MNKKIVIAIVFIGFACMQMASTLQCWQCTTLENCKHPSTVTCNQQNANATRNELKKYFVNVPNNTTNNFDCLLMNYTNYGRPIMQLAGCNYREINGCKLTVIFTVGPNWAQEYCNECSGNLCNIRKDNHASAVSASFYTLIISIVGVMLGKVL